MYQLEKAIDLAFRVHKNQKDRYGKPYIFHPLRVMNKMNDEKEKIVAVLHDVIEDSELTYKDLCDAGFSEEIIDAIASISKQDDEEYYDYIKRVMQNKLACKVKLADLEDNMDIRRIETITEKDAERLKKYLKAYRMIKGE
ncbi:MAG: GTP pyrophosphokinase [Ignavibacteria bacterium]